MDSDAERPVTGPADGNETRRGGGADRRRLRLVPPAVTPVRASDVAAGVAGQLRGRGRDRFRRAVERFLNAGSSGTYTSFRRALAGCLHGLAAAADDDRRTVLIPAFCSSDFPAAVEGVDLEPVRYDVDPETLSLDRASVEAQLDADLLAVVAVNVLGYSSPMAALEQRCDDLDVPLVEALGYALGTEYEGRRLGTFGDLSVLNFQQGKPIPVGGGMVVSRTPAIEFTDAGRPAVDANLGAVAGYAALSRPRPYYAFRRVRDALAGTDWVDGRATTHPESKVDVPYAPPFETMSDFQGAVAVRVLRELPAHRRHRARTAAAYADAFAACPGVGTLEPVEGLSKLQHVRFPVVAETEALRDRLQSALDAAGVQATTLYDWPVLDPDRYPGAASLQRRILTLPTHPYVDEQDRRIVVDTVRGVAAGN